MIRYALTALALCLTLTLSVSALMNGVMPPSIADQDDGVMGNWEGTFTSGDWAGKPIAAKIVADGALAWHMILYPQPGVRAETRVKRVLRRGGHFFKGTVEMDGERAVEARISGDEMGGTIGEGDTALEFKMERVFIKSPTLGKEPPADAIVLMDANDINLEKWKLHRPKWDVADNMAWVTSSGLMTVDEFGDFELHLEYVTPFMPGDRGQARGNSGLYIHGRYEIQVLDSFGVEPADNLAGGIYKYSVPAVDATLPPLSVQTYDVLFTAPKFDANGNKTANARITVHHNGLLIHDDVELPEPTPGGAGGPEAATGPIYLQHHGDRPGFGNIWIRPLN